MKKNLQIQHILPIYWEFKTNSTQPLKNKHFLVAFYNLCNILHNFIVVFLLDFKENIISLQTEN